MNEWHSFSHEECEHYISEYHIGFRVIQPQKGDAYEGQKFEFHSLVFMLKGEVELSYNEFIGHCFKQGDLFFMPQGSLIYGTAIVDSRMLILTFNNRVNSLCDNCTLSKHATLVQPTEYEFMPLPIHHRLALFISGMEEYIKEGIKCSYLHQLKQRELFILLQYCYTKEEVIKLFYPILGKPSFHSWVVENYKPEMSITELASQCNMAERTFSRKFVETFGITFRSWMLKQRVKHIKLRMSMPGASFKDIMNDFGFSNSSHFARFCKDNYGMTPSALVENLRSKCLV